MNSFINLWLKITLNHKKNYIYIYIYYNSNTKMTLLGIQLQKWQSSKAAGFEFQYSTIFTGKICSYIYRTLQLYNE